jgi:DNA-binding transcriptional LysR family regulator
VSRQIKALEEDLGVVLLARGKRSVALTQEGEIFYEEAQDLLAHIDRVVRRVQSNQSREVVRVGYTPSLVSDLLPKAIAHFKVLQRNEILAFRRLQSEFALRVLAIRRQRRVWFRNFDHH